MFIQIVFRTFRLLILELLELGDRGLGSRLLHRVGQVLVILESISELAEQLVGTVAFSRYIPVRLHLLDLLRT